MLRLQNSNDSFLYRIVMRNVSFMTKEIDRLNGLIMANTKLKIASRENYVGCLVISQLYYSLRFWNLTRSSPLKFAAINCMKCTFS